jgi:hypothetical protein
MIHNANTSMFLQDDAFGSGGISSLSVSTASQPSDTTDSCKMPNRTRSLSLEIEQSQDVAILMSISPAIASLIKPSCQSIFGFIF